MAKFKNLSLTLASCTTGVNRGPESLTIPRKQTRERKKKKGLQSSEVERREEAASDP